jgi:hypothetical protein
MATVACSPRCFKPDHQCGEAMENSERKGFAISISQEGVAVIRSQILDREALPSAGEGIRSFLHHTTRMGMGSV